MVASESKIGTIVPFKHTFGAPALTTFHFTPKRTLLDELVDDRKRKGMQRKIYGVAGARGARDGGTGKKECVAEAEVVIKRWFWGIVVGFQQSVFLIRSGRYGHHSLQKFVQCIWVPRICILKSNCVAYKD